MNIYKQLRKEHNLTQEELAEKLNVKNSVISKYEKGRARPSPEVLKKMSALFGTSIDRLLGNDFETESSFVGNATPSSSKELVEIADKLDDENYKTVVKVVRLLTENAERNRQQHFSDDEVSLINDYRALDEGRKQRARGVVEGLRLAVDNSRQAHLPLSSNNHVEVGTIAAPANITATQNVGVPK